MSKKIGWIGTGVMGAPMAGHLQAAGHELFIYNRSPAKAQALVDAGAILCHSPRAVAENTEIIFLIVGYPEDVEATILDENGILGGSNNGSVIIDMTTSEPFLAKRIHGIAKNKGVDVLDAPVSGGDIGARNATLAIMVGGEREVFDQIKPLLEILGQNIAYMGLAGAGQHTKMSNQILIASTMIGVVEALLYAFKAGLNREEVIAVIGSGAAGSWSINNLGPRIVDEDYAPGFFIKHFVKDMGIALTEAKRMNLSLPGLSLVNQFYQAAMAQGLEDMGTQGLYRVIQRLSGIEK
ncbi:MAG: NAD(P)-dependent oxidoreductase [Opitutae bacterium]|jgi:3-hydroxyisobutyrate dehydrogenase|nr:NAD(P)-dependent oxidoreductase [Opitutae bacterium]MBT5379325.1 NAD(P)-dependent oxidoreductase [Opitutae bacterium]MBT5690349.1 NAD(P)-dependent oxidoreductase [Opitutae bacterium]MBT7852313.1 NAD(P)-dependent oxidoreductase [Opitutae bacterium]